MSQITLDKSLFQRKEKKNANHNNNSSVLVTPNSNNKLEPEGITKLYVDVHEPPEIVEMLRKEKGIYVEVRALPVSDYCWSNIGIERKTLPDFYNSIVHGDKHIWKQIFNLKHAFERPMLIIERWDDYFLSSSRIENAVRGAIARIFLLGVSVLVIRSRGKDVRPFVDQLAFLFFSSDKKTLSMRPVPEKERGRTKKEVISDMLCMIPGIGRRQADLIKDHVNCIEDVCKMSNEELKKICPALGPKKLKMLRWILNGIERENNDEKSPREEK